MDGHNKLLVSNFHKYFSIALAITPKQKRSTYRIRYRVYCEEFGYEPADRFPEEEESDEYDEHALSCLITHRISGMPAACVRLIKAGEKGNKRALPFEGHSSAHLDRAFFRNFDAPRSTVCEISRLAVDGAFRRRSGEQATRFGEVDNMDLSQQERRTFGLLAVTAFLAATALTDLTGRTNVFAMMEPFLPRILKRSGIEFEKVGEDIDYHGYRAPYFSRTPLAVAGMLPDLRKFYKSIYELIKDDYIAE